MYQATYPTFRNVNQMELDKMIANVRGLFERLGLVSWKTTDENFIEVGTGDFTIISATLTPEMLWEVRTVFFKE
jgi:hypothetical protein